jgi:hypothetical protein
MLAVTTTPAAGFPLPSVTTTAGCTLGSNTSRVSADVGGLVVIAMGAALAVAVATNVTGEP